MLKNAVLGIEFGSTRVKAVLLDENHMPVASGSYEWENRYENGYWTYSFEEICTACRACYGDLKRDVKEKFGVTLNRVATIGISGMMHGYLPFDEEGNLLAPFRTWRNTTTGEAARQLTELFGFNIPQRWSVAHLYQAVLNDEAHLPRLRHLTTLAGYIHWRLTGRWVMGVGEASGMFPIDSDAMDYDGKMHLIYAEGTVQDIRITMTGRAETYTVFAANSLSAGEAIMVQAKDDTVKNLELSYVTNGKAVKMKFAE